jgi:wyosine [tRNA(Phe)-imidazoG37] synthetase (radical SAM superfamily)
MNDINKIYDAFGKDFCLCPYLGAFYQTNQLVFDETSQGNNTVVPCSVINWSQHPNAINIVDNSIKTTLNTPIWVNLRKNLAEGKLKETRSCETCTTAERLGGSSPRIGANLHFSHHLKTTDIITEVQKIIDNDYRIDDVYSLDWFPSNYCNYSCVMCSGGASSGRVAYEIKFLGHKKKRVVINAVDSDFHDVLKKVEVINFTGGETLMQPQVHDLMKYMVENNMAANKTLFFLTNASSGPEKLMELYSHFRKIIYMCSIDGVGEVIEYQRRGAKWDTVEKNSLTIINTPSIATVINLVLTSMNALNIADFIKWLDHNQIKCGVSVTSVYRENQLSMDAMPEELRQLAIDRVLAVYDQYPNYQNFMDMALSNMRQAVYNANYHRRFCEYIKNEDRDSVKPFCSVVPEWEKYFTDL